jgi:hypothetical protein
VVAGQREDRRGETSERARQFRPDRGVAVAGQIARDQHGVGARPQRVQMIDRAFQTAGDVDPAERERTLGQEVQIGNLSEQHGMPRGRAVDLPDLEQRRSNESSDLAAGIPARTAALRVRRERHRAINGRRRSRCHTTIDIWRTARELVRWRGTDAPQYVAQKAAVCAAASTVAARHDFPILGAVSDTLPTPGLKPRDLR